MDKVVWNGCAQCTYTFNNPNREGWWIKNFMKFVRSCEIYDRPATKRGFMKLIGKDDLPSGHMNTFFAAVKNAGIVTAKKEWNGSFTDCVFTQGPNWYHYLNGNLQRRYF